MNTESLPTRANASTGAGDPGIGELFSRLAKDTGFLIKQEVKLATMEMTTKAVFAGKQVGILAGAALIAVVALLTFVAALVLGLGTMIPMWASSLLVGGLLVAVAAGFALRARAALRTMEFTPKQTVQTLEDTKSWLQAQVR